MTTEKKAQRKGTIGFITALIGLMWIGFICQKIYPELTNYGLQPRTIHGLWGIILSPFLHGNLNHIISNTMGLITFGAIYTVFEGKQPIRLIVSLMVYSGILGWLFGPNENSIGMSGVIFGLYAFLLSVGFFHKKIKYIMASAIVILGYGSVLWGLIPLDSHISWTGHWIGFLTGIAIAKWKDY